MRISHFKWSLYKQCPLKYKYHYIDGLSQAYEKEMPYLSMGDSVHKALFDFFSIQNIEERTLDKLLELLDQDWESKDYANKDEEIEYKTRAKNMLCNFFNKEDFTIKPSYLEIPFSVTIIYFILNTLIYMIYKLPY